MLFNDIDTHKPDNSLMLPAINTRQATINDLDIIAQYTFKLHQHEDDRIIAPHVDFLSNLKMWLSAELNNSRSLFLIAELDTIPIGFIGATSIINDNGFLANPIKGVIQLLWVEENYRKNRIAKKLVDEVEQCFKSIGIEYVECTYTAQNTLANSFWEKRGYEKNSITARKFISD